MTSTTPYGVLVADKGYPGSLQTWLDHDSLPSTLLVAQAEQYLYRRLRLREMLAIHEGTIVEGEDKVEAPPRYLEPRTVTLVGGTRRELRHQLPEHIERYRAYDEDGALVRGEPGRYYVDGSHMRFETAAERDYPFRMVFYQQPEPLGPGNERNVLTEKGFRLLLCTAVAFAHEWLDDERERERWLGAAEREMQVMQAESDKAMSRNIDIPIFAG